MASLHKAKIAVFKARLETAEAERKRIVETATKYKVNLAQIAYRLDQVENEIRALSHELRLLEVPEPEE
ncbi:MAG: hypothetical protein WA354_21755 [Terracidiphilus sp.]